MKILANQSILIAKSAGNFNVIQDKKQIRHQAKGKMNTKKFTWFLNPGLAEPKAPKKLPRESKKFEKGLHEKHRVDISMNSLGKVIYFNRSTYNHSTICINTNVKAKKINIKEQINNEKIEQEKR